MSINTIFIDLDDTLWDFTMNSELSLKHSFESFDLERYCADYQHFRAIYKKRNDELWELYHYGKIDKEYLVNERFRHTLEAIGYNRLDILELAKSIDTEYLRFLALQPTVVEGAVELLQYLNNKYGKIGILSNGFKGVQAQKLKSGNLDSYIDLIVLSEDVGITKPLRGIFDKAASLREALPEQCIMIGDNYDADIMGASNAGWHAIHFNRKGVAIENSVADYTVARLCEIKDIL